jgi:hypothetical protein
LETTLLRGGKIMKKIVLALMVLVLCISVNAFAANGTPFQELQRQIDQLKTQLQNIQLTPGPPGPAGPAGEGAIKVYDASGQYLV